MLLADVVPELLRTSRFSWSVIHLGARTNSAQRMRPSRCGVVQRGTTVAGGAPMRALALAFSGPLRRSSPRLRFPPAGEDAATDEAGWSWRIPVTSGRRGTPATTAWWRRSCRAPRPATRRLDVDLDRRHVVRGKPGFLCSGLPKIRPKPGYRDAVHGIPARRSRCAASLPSSRSGHDAASSVMPRRIRRAWDLTPAGDGRDGGADPRPARRARGRYWHRSGPRVCGTAYSGGALPWRWMSCRSAGRAFPQSATSIGAGGGLGDQMRLPEAARTSRSLASVRADRPRWSCTATIGGGVVKASGGCRVERGENGSCTGFRGRGPAPCRCRGGLQKAAGGYLVPKLRRGCGTEDAGHWSC